MNCKEFADLWLILFPESKCWKYKTNIGTTHWVCELSDKKLIDANYKLTGRIEIRNKK